jgi:hypothetical protein
MALKLHQMHLLAERIFLGGDDQGFLKEGWFSERSKVL